MAGYGIGQKPLTCYGIDLTRPVDRVVVGKFPLLENVTALIDGTISPRHGMGASAYATGPAGKTPWHSMRTLSDPNAGSPAWSRVFGIGDRLCDERSTAPGTINNLLGGFSGNPLGLVLARPPESPQPWMYVADSLLMRKVDRSGNVHGCGLAAPTGPPVAYVASAAIGVVDLFDATTGWAAGGGAAAPTLLSAGTGYSIDTTLAAAGSFAEDNAGNGVSLVSCVVPASMASIVVGSVVKITTTAPTVENVLVTETHGGSDSAAITAILYDSGTTGLCSMVLAHTPPEIEVNSVLLITGVATAGSEYVRVLAVIPGPGGTACIRTRTTVNRAATDTAQAKASFTCYPINTVSGTTQIRSDGLHTTSAATAAGTPATLSKVASLDLSKVTAWGTTGLTPADYMSVEFRVDRPDLITEIRLLADCDANSVSAGAFTATAFLQNYFMRVITASDLANLLKFNETALANRQNQVQRRVVDQQPTFDTPSVRGGIRGGLRDDESPGAPGSIFNRGDDFTSPTGSDITSDPSQPAAPSRDQLGPGENQFFSVRFRLSEMQRMGSDDSRGFRDIVGLRIAVLCTGTIALDVDSWIVAGGYEPEVDDLDEGYRYAYRARCSSTGVVSNLSPASQTPARAARQAVYLTLTQHPATECDKLDIYRRGGSAAVPGWRYLATIDNGATPTYVDTIGNEATLANPEYTDAYDHLALWPLPQKPAKGTATTLAGTLVKSSAAFPDPATSPWLPGMPFVAGGVHTQLRRHISASLVEVEVNCGAGTSTTWEAPAPVVIGQPLPILFEWPGEARLIGLGDPQDPGAFYVTRRRAYDSTIETLRYEIPGATLLNGCAYNGSPYLLSTERQYRVDHGGYDADGNLVLRAVEVPGSWGLAARWALACGDRMYWLARDGIAVGAGGEPELLTDADLYPLFPHAGLPGIAVNGFQPPDLSAASEAKLRLSWGDSRLWFDYPDALGARRSLEFRKRGGPDTSGWYPHAYAKPVGAHYFEEGPGKHALWLLGADSPTAKLYLATEATSDAGSSIAWRVQTQSENVGDPRKRKRWGDLTTEIDADGASVAVVVGFDNHAATQTPATSPVTGSSGVRQITIHDITDGVTVGGGREATNISLALSGSVSTERPKLYGWEPTWIDRPEVTARRATDFDDGGFEGTKFAQSLRLRFDSKGASRSVVVQIDGNGGANIATITGIVSAGYGPTWQTFPFDPATAGTGPFVYRTARIVPVDAGSWQLFDAVMVFEPEPDAVTYYETQQTTHDIEETWKVLRDTLLVLRSVATVTLSVLDAADRSVLYSVAVASTAGLRKPNYLPLASKKAKALIYTLQSAQPFAVYARDSWVRVRGWGRSPEWHTMHPFGDRHREIGATT